MYNIIVVSFLSFLLSCFLFSFLLLWSVTSCIVFCKIHFCPSYSIYTYLVESLDLLFKYIYFLEKIKMFARHFEIASQQFGSYANFYLCYFVKVAILDGITMGGGAGVSVPGTFRIATDKTV